MHIFWMPQRKLGCYRPSKGVRDKCKRPLHFKRVQYHFQVIHQAIHTISQRLWVIAESVSTQIRSNNTRGLAKEAHLVQPLQRASTITMHKNERSSRTLWLNIEHADATYLFLRSTTTRTTYRNIDSPAVQLYI